MFVWGFCAVVSLPFLGWLVLAAKCNGTDPLLFGRGTNRSFKIKGENKVNIIDKALSSKKEVEELEKELINKKSKMKELKKIAKDDLEWILKEEVKP